MNLKLAGYVNKRTFSVIRFNRGKPDFVPCFITNRIPKALEEIDRLKQGEFSSYEWKLHVLLDNGDWHLVEGDNYRYYA